MMLMDRTRKIPANSIVTRLVIFFVATLVLGCGERDRCEPPFDARMGLLGILSEGPIEAGKDFGITVVIYASSVAELEDVDIVVVLPPELEIKTVVQPKDGPKVVQTGNTLRWETALKPSFYRSLMGLPISNEFTLWLNSTKNWKEWSRPIELNFSLNYSGECRNYQNGHYSETIIWSHQVSTDTGWIGPDNKSYK